MTSPAPSHAGRYPAGSAAFPHRGLVGIAGLAPHEILFLLDEAEQWVELNRQPQKRDDRLAGLTIINAFFENSTRTLLSFEIAGKRLGADVVNMHAAQSSVKKGETLIDTAMTLNAMRADAIVIRHASSGAVKLIAGKVDCPVLNAGDGQHEHPTQALLDALTIRHAFGLERGGMFNGLRITICGDILHSRVARSNIHCLTTLGADVRVCAPPALMPEGIEAILQKTGGGEKLRAHLNASHSVVDDVARIAKDAGVGMLALNHLVPVDDARFTHADWLARVAAVWDGPTLIGVDGLEIAL